ncbi:MAG: hypothetical protein JSR32_06145 [Proteobacteria bacterium]|nr:hypothetical protein [Pseudomonadota bacterium]
MDRAVGQKSLTTPFMWRLTVLCGIVLTLLALYAKAMDRNAIAIGIISPKDGSSLVLASESNEESIRLAFDHLEPLQVGDLQIKLKLIPWNDSGKPEMATDGAIKLVQEDHVVAILGPVNSGSTKEALQIWRSAASTNCRKRKRCGKSCCACSKAKRSIHWNHGVVSASAREDSIRYRPHRFIVSPAALRARMV